MFGFRCFDVELLYLAETLGVPVSEVRKGPELPAEDGP